MLLKDKRGKDEMGWDGSTKEEEGKGGGMGEQRRERAKGVGWANKGGRGPRERDGRAKEEEGQGGGRGAQRRKRDKGVVAAYLRRKWQNHRAGRE